MEYAYTVDRTIDTPYQIEAGVPIPPVENGANNRKGGRRKGALNRYPFRAMQVGDSFFVPLADLDRPKAFSAVAAKAAIRTGFVFVTRRISDEGYRVWRIG